VADRCVVTHAALVPGGIGADARRWRGGKDDSLSLGQQALRKSRIGLDSLDVNVIGVLAHSQVHRTGQAHEMHIDLHLGKVQRLALAHFLGHQVIEASDGLVVSTPFLKTKFSTEFNCKRIDIIENCVSMKDFRTRHHKSRRPKVGWVGSTSHRSGDLELLRGVLDAGSWRVHHSGHVEGAVHFADRVGLARNRVTLTPMHHPLNYARLSFEFDIGLAPITDIPFNRAKSWIKAIEYAAAGIPMVMSNVSEYTRLHNEYGIGRLASTPEEWIDNIYDLTDFKTRSQEGKQVRERVQALDVSTMAKNWDALFDSYM